MPDGSGGEDDAPTDARPAEPALEDARRQLYTGSATAGDLDVYLALRQDLDAGLRRATDEESRAVPAAPARVRMRDLSPWPPRRIRPAVAALTVLLALWAGFIAGSWLPAAPPGNRAVDRADMPLVAALTGSDGSLATGTATTRVVAASDALDGAVPIGASGLSEAARVRLVVRCPARDDGFRASVTPVGRLSGTAVLHGRCGRIETVPLPASDGTQLQVVVTTDGPLPFSAVLLEQ